MTKETIQQRLARMRNELDKPIYSQSDVKNLLHMVQTAPGGDKPEVVDTAPDGAEDLPTTMNPRHKIEVQRGDVFVAPGVGGKQRPWVILHVLENSVVALALTTKIEGVGNTEVNCRYWPGSFLGTATNQFSMKNVYPTVTRPLTDFKALKQAEDAIIASLSAPSNVVEFTSVRKKNAA